MTPQNTELQKTDNGSEVAVPTRGERTYRPNVDVLETEEELTLRVDLPGADADAVDVRYEDGRLTLAAKVPAREPESGATWRQREYGVGAFERSFTVGEHVEASAITAEYAAGVLTLHLPKVAALRPRRIVVQSS